MIARESLRELLYKYYEKPFCAFFDRIGFTPNMVTLLGLLIILISTIFISVGYFWIGGIIVAVGGALDLIDGALARKKGLVSKFGALFDSVADRLQEALVLLGLLIHYSLNNCVSSNIIPFNLFEGFNSCAFAQIMTYTAFVGSVMVSYLRSRAEGLGIECKVGIMTRPERVAIISVGLVIAHWVPVVMIVVLMILTGLGFFTTIQRLMHSSKKL
jgi:CDP-diacylglycerol--glycerol-3-phosphate 3-phosphatidyltransferase